MGVRYWCSCAKSPFVLNIGLLVPRDDDQRSLRVWQACWLERHEAHSVERTGRGRLPSEQSRLIETQVLTLPWGSHPTHLPPQGTQEVQGRTRVLLQTIINTDLKDVMGPGQASAKQRL